MKTHFYFVLPALLATFYCHTAAAQDTTGQAQENPGAEAETVESKEALHRPVDLETLVVTSSPLAGHTVLDSAQPITVLEGEALQRKKAATIGETVAGELGISSSYFGPGAGRPVIRGLSGPRVRVLNNGLSALDVSTVSADHAVAIEPLLADRIEILRGPSTLLYGSGALGGVINVIDGRVPDDLPVDGLSGGAVLRADTVADTRAGVFRLDGGVDSFAWHIDGFKRDTDDYEILGFAAVETEHEEEHEEEHEDEHEEAVAGILPNSDIETQGFAGGASFVSDSGHVGISLSQYETNYGVPGGHEHGHEEEETQEPEAGHGAEEVRIDLEQERFDLEGEYLNPINGIDRVRFRLGINDYRHVELEGDEVGTIFNNNAYEGRVELLHAPVGGWRGAFGAQFGERDFEAIGAEAFTPPSVTEQQALFIVEERELGSGHMELGARVEHQSIDVSDSFESRSHTGYTLSGGYVQPLADDASLALYLTRSERLPTAEALYSNGPHLATSSFEIGNPDLDKETAKTIDLSFRKVAGRLQSTVNLYYYRIDDFIFQRATGEVRDDLPVRVYTQAEAELYGYEAEIVYRLFEGDAGQFETRIWTDYVRGKLVDGGDLPRITPMRYGLGLNWYAGAWSANLDVMRVSDQDDVARFETPTDGYVMVDAAVHYHVFAAGQEWSVFLKGENLTDEEARLHTSIIKEEVPLPGRNFSLGLRVLF